MIDLVLENANLITMNANNDILLNKDIFINQGEIISIKDTTNKKKKPECRFKKNVTNKYLLPGFVNTHTHIFQTLLRGIGADLNVWDWFKIALDDHVSNLTREHCYISAKLGAMEAIRSGTTTILDYNYPHPSKYLVDECFEAFNSVGIRSIIARAIIDQGKAHPKIINNTEEEINDCIRLLEKYHKNDNDSQYVWLAPYTIFSTSLEAYKRIVKLAEEFETFLTIHASTPSTIDECLALYGMKDIEFQHSQNFLSKNVLAAHCTTDIDEKVLAILKECDVKISHNPASNCYLGEGIAPIKEMLENGLTVGLGTDGPASNNNHDMIFILKLTALLQKVKYLKPEAISAEKVLRLATIEGAKCVGLEKKIGSIELGKKADISIFDLHSLNTSKLHDPIKSIVYSANQENISDVIINGEFILKDRKFVNQNEKDVVETAELLGEDLVNKSKFS